MSRAARQRGLVYMTHGSAFQQRVGPIWNPDEAEPAGFRQDAARCSEVEPQEPVTGGSERAAIGECHPGVLEQEAGRVFAEVELSPVGPEQVAAFGAGGHQRRVDRLQPADGVIAHFLEMTPELLEPSLPA